MDTKKIYSGKENGSRIEIKVNKVIEENNLNKRLLKENEVFNSDIIAMDYYYKKIKALFELSKILEDTKEFLDEKQYKKEAKLIGKEVEKCEKELQKLWKFELFEPYYVYWFKIPGCKCPYSDNYENRGIKRIINCECPYHKFIADKLKKQISKKQKNS